MDKKTLPNEHKLIFLCARLKINSSLQQKIKELISHPTNWNEIIEISRRHQILTLIYYNLNKLNLKNIIPKDIYYALENSYYLNLDRNIKLHREFSSVLEAINSIQIDIIILKGVHLTEIVYKNPALRAMADIDILIKEKELKRLKALLLQLGYQEAIKNVPANFIQRYQITFGFIKAILPNLSLYIDVHRKLVPARPYNINLPLLWERTQKKSLAGLKVSFLSREDTLLFLALHLKGHMRQPLPLKSICDIAELLNLYKNNLDWCYIQTTARKNHLVSNVYFALYISKELLDVSVSGELLNKFKLGILRNKLMHLCMNRYNFLNAAIWQGFILRFLLFDRFIDFLLYLWRVSFLERFIARRDYL